MGVKRVTIANLSGICSRYAPKGQILLTTTTRSTRARYYSTERQTAKPNGDNDGRPEASSFPGQADGEGAMSRRLSEMTEQAMLEGGRSARRNVEQVGFSEELKKQLEERIAASSFKSEYAAAHSVVNMPVCQHP